MKRGFKGISIFAAVVMTMGLVGCGGSNSASAPAMYAEESYDNALYDSKSFAGGSTADYAEAPMEEGTVESQEVTDSSRKLITTMNISAETEDLDSVLSSVETRVKDLGGYIEASSIYNGSKYYGRDIVRNASLTIRIPASKLDSFIAAVQNETNITNKSTNVEDVTLHYVDIESRKNALKEEEKRLLEIVQSAETVEDIIKVEERLADVRYEIESIESQLRTYDNKINYSTVYLDIEEVTRFTETEPKGAIQRMGEGFMESVADVISAIVEAFVWLVIHIPQIIICIILIAVVIIIIRAIDKAGKKKNLKKMQMMQANMQPYAPVNGQNVYQPGNQTVYNNQAPAQNPIQNQTGNASPVQNNDSNPEK